MAASPELSERQTTSGGPDEWRAAPRAWPLGADQTDQAALDRTLIERRPRLVLNDRRLWALLGGWTLLWFAVLARHGGYSWHYFRQAGTLLFDGAAAGAPAGGLHVYANYPQLQFGPVTFVTAQGLRLLDPAGVIPAEAIMTTVGLFVLYTVQRITVTLRPELAGDARLRLALLIGGGAFLIGWVDLAAGYGHLDDVLALLFVTLAAWALVSDLPAVAGICLALSVDSKPWALVFLPLVFAASRAARKYVVFCTAVAVLLAWLPFVLVDLHTLTAAQYAITNQPSSALRALGVSSPTTPGWDRPAQIILGCLLGAVAIRRRRWQAVIVLGIGARLVLDPGVYNYYTVGLLLGALLWDMLRMRWPVPVWTLLSGLALGIAPLLTSNATLLGDVRLWLLLGLMADVLITPARRYPPSVDTIAPSRALRPASGSVSWMRRETYFARRPAVPRARRAGVELK
ncbi:hypothetical protein [Catenulispora rubra]|uniref:hypothetical protein n=1 Tax=Catenulispora rubra TaxID=280293 RepID=UPI0018925591|nr:hypothetical protein [Catenulispora rubra]